MHVPDFRHPRGPRHYIHGWNAASIAAQVERDRGEPLDHCAADSYGGIVGDDTLWVVSMKAGLITLRYRFVVERVVGQQEAESIRGESLWRAEWHLLGRGTRLLEHPISHLAPDLRFDSADRPRLQVDDEGRVSNQAFRTARRLHPSSAELLAHELSIAEREGHFSRRRAANGAPLAS